MRFFGLAIIWLRLQRVYARLQFLDLILKVLHVRFCRCPIAAPKGNAGEKCKCQQWNASHGALTPGTVRAGGFSREGFFLKLADNGKAVLRLVAVPKKPLLVTCSADATVKVWNDNLGAVRTLTGFSDHVYAVAVSPDGNLVAAGAFNGEVRVWNLNDGKRVKDFNASPGLKVAKK